MLISFPTKSGSLTPHSRVFDTGPSLAMCRDMKVTRHIRKLDQSFWIRNTRRLLSSVNQKRYILLIFALVILAGYQVKSQNNTSFNGFDLVDKNGIISKPSDYRD